MKLLDYGTDQLDATGAQLDAIAQQGSLSNESDNFWIAYAGSAWQYAPDSDSDPQYEGGSGGVCYSITSNTSVAKGGNSSWVFVETCNDRMTNNSPPADPGLIERDVVHEIAHQLGLDHLSGTIMNSSQEKMPSNTGFDDIHLDLLRQRVKSPGN